MRNIWRIIRADARSLFTHFFALAVALAIAVLPSLYAWLNIYSNWDPYGSTGNISIAVASLDKGWTEEDGTQVNKGREVVEDLRTSTSINWVAVDTKEEAERGVYAGDYYAAVVIDEDFSYNMYHMLTEWTDKPTITYYENYKKNAVATKITDTAVSSLKTTISTTKTYEPGTSVSYGRLFTTQRRTRMGVVPYGYADGFFRCLSDRCSLMTAKGPAPQRGRICMDMSMIDLTDLPGVDVGDEVEIFGPRNPVEVMAAQAGTIPYELTCAVSKRVPRVYLQNGQVTERELLLRF
jgi:YhgE/Pip-like protein